jgi:hypothetical protein
MSDQVKPESGVRTAPMPKDNVNTSRASLAELIKRTNETSVRITAKSDNG